jgi:hypothetical protein
MMWEGIPGSVMQMYAIIKYHEALEYVQIVSLFASALAAGAISARMSYYLDTSVKQQEKAGNFYGYVPDGLRGRLIIQAAMMMISLCQLVSRALAYALIAAALRKFFVICAVVLELGTFFVVKLVRRDFYYQGFLSKNRNLLASVIARFTCKIVTDFTSIMAGRNPNEVGGKSLRLFLSNPNNIAQLSFALFFQLPPPSSNTSIPPFRFVL